MSQHIYIGIDPGMEGAVAAIAEDGSFLSVVDAPVVEVRHGHKYVPTQMADVVRSLAAAGNAIVGLEVSSGLPRLGRRGGGSSFTQGRGIGLWEGVIAALCLPSENVTPQRWKKAMGLPTGSTKGASIVRACELFPAASEFLKRKKDDGRAEALLIAEYTRRQYVGGGGKLT